MSFFGKLFANKTSGESELKPSSKSQKQPFIPGSFNELYERHALLSYARQSLLGEEILNKSWQFNMGEGTLAFEGDPVYPMQLLGSVSFLDNTWMWSWANTQSGIPSNLQKDALKLKTLGEKYGISELREPKINVSEGFEHRLGAIASGICGKQAYYCANYGKGTAVVTIDRGEQEDEFLNKIERIVTTNPGVLTSLDVNQLNAFKGFLADFNYQISQEGSLLKGLKDGKGIVAEFDQQSRLISLKS